MIETKNISVFDSGCEALVNPINCLGKMGKGLALEFKKRYPEMFSHYVNLCKSHQVQIGKVYGYPTYHLFKSVIIIGFPTKLEYWKPSKIEYIEKGIDSLVELIRKSRIKSIAIPKLGCGYGGLNWINVKELILEKLSEFKDDKEIKIIICEY